MLQILTNFRHQLEEKKDLIEIIVEILTNLSILGVFRLKKRDASFVILNVPHVSFQ